MQRSRAILCLVLGMAAACATPGQVQRVETAVSVADRDRARSDSAQRAELARIEIMQRQTIDSMMALYRALNDVSARMGRDNASNFDDLRQRLYQVVAAQGTVAQSVSKLRNQVDAAVTSAPPVPVTTDTTGRTTNPNVIPQPSTLIEFAQQAMRESAYPSARRSLNQLLTTYPTAPEVPEALYQLGYSFDAPETIDSARVYYTRVWTSYPKSDRAPTALLKLGNVELKANNLVAARKYWQQVVDGYPQSLEFGSAQANLRDHP